MANKNTFRIELIGAELCALSKVLFMAVESMEWDDILKCYSDGGRYICALNGHELNALSARQKRFNQTVVDAQK